MSGADFPLLAVTVLTVTVLTVFTGPLLADPPGDLTLVTLTDGGGGALFFDDPVAVRHAGDGSGRLFVVERPGRIRVIDGGEVAPEPFLDISALISTSGELGLLGLAFHPSFASNGHFYVHWAHPSPALESAVERYTVSGADPNLANPASVLRILTVAQDFSNHNGGDLHFGPDGSPGGGQTRRYLYVGLGDGGGSGDPKNRAQDLGSLLGKILRLDVDAGTPFAIPPGNPFVGDGGALDEIWAYGLRNPWRFSFDRRTGDLFIADVGQGEIEEIDVQDAASAGGENYGWDCREGNQAYTGPGSGVCSGPLVDPVVQYTHALGCSVTGGFRYRGHGIVGFDGTYVFADYCSDRMWFATETGPGVWSAAEWPGNTATQISSFGEDEAGELYVVSLGGTIARFTSPSSIFTDGFESGDVAAWSSISP